MRHQSSQKISSLPPPPRPLVAVMDIGSTFIRMTIAEGAEAGGFNVVERVIQSVAIGREVVATKRVSNATVEKCVDILRSYLQLLKEYAVPADTVRVIATAAVREAENGDAFIDRLSMATGLRLAVLDVSEVGYHRKAVPQLTHADYAALSHDDRLVVCKLAALLRVADALDRVHDQSLGDIRFDLQDEILTCIPPQPVDISAEQLALAEKGDLFEQIYGRRCLIRNP